MGFTKLDEGIVFSSIMGEDDSVFRVWIVLLATCKQNGIAPVSEVFLSTITKKTIEEIQRCLTILESPDSNSRSKNDDGCRIKRIDGGFEIINYAKYRGQTANDYFREYQRKRKENQEQQPEPQKPPAPPKEKKKFIPPTQEEVKAYFIENGFSEEAATRFYEGYAAATPPWTDREGKQIRSWKTKAQQVWFKPEHKTPPPKNLAEYEQRKKKNGKPPPPPAAPTPEPAKPTEPPTPRDGKGMVNIDGLVKEVLDGVSQ